MLTVETTIFLSVDEILSVHTNHRSKARCVIVEILGRFLYIYRSICWGPFLEIMVTDLLTERIFFFPQQEEKISFEEKKNVEKKILVNGK